MKSQDSKEEKLRDELETIYQRVAEEEEPDLLPPEQESRPFFGSKTFLALLTGTAFAVLVLAFFFWPPFQNALYHYEMTESGGKTYAVRTHRITGAMTYFDGEKWKSPPKPTPDSSAIPPLPAAPSATPQLTLPAKQAVSALAAKPERTEKPAISQEAPPSKMPMDEPARVKAYAIQVSAMRSYELAREFVEVQKKTSQAVYLVKVNLGKRGVWYRIYLGRFTGRAEAARYMREKKIKGIFPDSFIQRVSS